MKGRATRLLLMIILTGVWTAQGALVDLKAFERPAPPDNPIVTAFARALSMSKDGSWEASVPQWEACCAQWQDAAEPHYNRGCCLLKAGVDRQEVLKAFGSAFGSHPTPSLAVRIAHNHGLVLLQSGMLPEGLESLKLAMKLLGPRGVDELLVAAKMCEAHQAWQRAASLYREAGKIWSGDRTRFLPGVPPKDAHRFLEYLALMAESNIEVFQAKLADASQVEGTIVGGSYHDKDYGDAPSENILRISLSDSPDEIVEIEKDKIRFAKFKSKVSEGDASLGVDLGLIRKVKIQCELMPLASGQALRLFSRELESKKMMENALIRREICFRLEGTEEDALALAELMAKCGRATEGAEILTDLSLAKAKKDKWEDADKLVKQAIKMDSTCERASGLLETIDTKLKVMAETEKGPTLKVGRVYMIGASIPVGVDVASYDAFLKAVLAEDSETSDQLMEQGKIFVTEEKSTVKYLATAPGFEECVEIQFLVGPREGEKVFVLKQAVTTPE